MINLKQPTTNCHKIGVKMTEIIDGFNFTKNRTLIFSKIKTTETKFTFTVLALHVFQLKTMYICASFQALEYSENESHSDEEIARHKGVEGLIYDF